MKRHVLSKMVPFHPLFIKKDPNGAVLNGIVGLLLPLDARAGEEEYFLSPAFLSPFLRENSKSRRPKAPTCLSSDPWPTTVWKKQRGRAPLAVFGAAAQWPPLPLPPCFSYQYRGKEQKRGGRKGEGSEH